MNRQLRVLILFECSGTSREAFRQLGHQAYSLDVQPADDQSDNHIQRDALRYLEDYRHEVQQRLNGKPFYDLMIMHPVCKALANSGNRWYGRGKPKHHERIKAMEFTEQLWLLAIMCCKYVALENPTGVLGSTKLGSASQYIQPWEHGHGETKKTGLWLHNLPLLKPSNIVEGREQRVWKMPPSEERSKLRSKTYEGVAKAWAKQWSEHIQSERLKSNSLEVCK